jgi:Fe-S-cluster containining protein
MENKEDLAQINPVQLEAKSKLKFKCHKGLNCFTKCCRGISIILTPYDIIRLKNRLQLPSDQFLAIYTKPELLEKTDLPVITLKLLDDEQESCPFVKDTGCIIYEDRPTACRYYPVGVATLSNKEEHEDGFYFLINESHCEGFNEDNIQTITEWRKDQGVDIHDEINEGWAELLVKKRSFPKNIKLTDQSKKMFFMISYNIDEFKKFVFDSSFLKKYVIDDAVIEDIKKDEKALLRFGIRWLTHILFNKDKKESPEFKLSSE